MDNSSGLTTDNGGVARAWSAGRAAHSGNMSTDGQTIYSYRHIIGTTNADGDKLGVCCHYSITTASKHVPAVRYSATRMVECAEHGRPDLHKNGRRS